MFAGGLIVTSAGCATARPAAAPTTEGVTAATPAPVLTEAHADVSGTTYQVTSEVTVEAPIDVVWSTLDDAQAYWAILPRVSKLEPERRADGSLVLRVAHAISVVNGVYTMRLVKTAPYVIEGSTVDAEPRSFAWATFRISLEAEGADRTRVRYHIELDPGGSVVLRLISGKLERALARPPHLLKAHVEQGRRAASVD